MEAVTFGPRGGNRSSFRYFGRIRESTVLLEKALGMLFGTLFGTMEIGWISDNYVGEIVECFNTNLRSIESRRNKDGSVW